VTARNDSIIAARNSLRSLFGNKTPKRWYKNIDTVRSMINSANSNQILSLTEAKAHYAFPGLGNTFPVNPSTIPFIPFNKLKPLTEEREFFIQTARINFHSTRVCETLESLSTINHILSIGAPSEKCINLIYSHAEEFGWSFVLLKKLLLAILLTEGLPGLSKKAHEVSSQFDRTVWGYYCHFLYDMMDPSYDPHSALLMWRKRLQSADERSRWYTLIFNEIIDGEPRSSDDFASTLMYLGNSSLLDTVLFVRKHRNRFENKSNVVLDERVAYILEAKFQHIKISPASVFGNEGSNLSDLELYRNSLFFDDITDISSWRRALNSLVLVGKQVSTESEVGQALSSLSSSTSLRPATVKDVAAQQLGWQCGWLATDKWTVDSHLLRATFLARLLEQNPGPLLEHRDELAELISENPEIHGFVKRTSIIKMIKHSQAEDLLSFVLRDVLFKQKRSRDNDLERRIVFMSIINKSNHINIAEFIRETSIELPAVANFIANTCTRTFLERLYLLMSSIKDVIRTRIEICEWMGSNSEENENLKEEISSLKREYANLDTRSDLDSTRIHVDEESLREWFWETQKAAVNRLIQTVLAEGKGSGNFSLLRFLSTKDKHQNHDDVKIESQLGSEHLLLTIFSATLTAFASDKSFGLDAYLSRRIRHGTLSGSIMTPLSRIVKRIEELRIQELPEDIDPSQDIGALTVQWRKAFAVHLDDARKNVIQLQQNSERGLISADWRTAHNIAHVDAAISRIRSRIIESKGVYDIFPDLYALCWDCIEPDLAQLRRYLLRELLPRENAALMSIWSNLNPRSRAVAHNGFQHLGMTLQNKIHEVCGWFIRPVFRRDSYSLRMLITSTLSIVRELDENYEFEEDIDVSDDLTLNRASFDVFGDLLFVVLGNAAKHGKRKGTIKVTSTSTVDDNGETIIAVDVRSLVDDLEVHELAVDRIQSAMQIDAKEIDKAAVGEGFSGLGKAVGIMRNVRSTKASLVSFANAQFLEIQFIISLPAQIVANRNQ